MSRSSLIVFQMANTTRIVPEVIIEDVLIKVGKLIILIDFIVLDYDTNDRVPILLGCPFLATEGALIDVREGTLTIKQNDKEVVFKVYQTLTPPSHYKDLCIITTKEVDEFGVEECKPPMTSLNSLIELPKPPIEADVEKLKEEPEKASVEKAADLESRCSRGQKRVRRRPSSRRKRLKEYG